MGTGNDLARCLGWGGGYERNDLARVFAKLENAERVLLDRFDIHAFLSFNEAFLFRWKIDIVQEADDDKGDPVPYTIVNNYFSIGVVSTTIYPALRRLFVLRMRQLPAAFTRCAKSIRKSSTVA